MKKLILAIFVLSFQIIFTACEDDVVNITLPYVEKLQVQGVLNAGESVNRIFIRKTLPPLDNYEPEKAFVSDAVVTVTDESGKSFQFKNLGDDRYENSELIPVIGKKYKLLVTWKNHKAFAETFIPQPCDTISSGYVETSEGYGGYEWYKHRDYYMKIKTKPNTSYFVNNDESYYSYIDFGITGLTGGEMRLIYYKQYQDYNGQYYKPNRITVTIYSFDPKFYNYYSTKENGSSESTFFGGGTKIDWNVSGDAIGYFVGCSSIQFEKF